MLNQMFTAENFREVFDTANRKGTNLEALFFPSLAVHTGLVRRKIEEIRDLNRKRSALSSSTYDAGLSSLRRELDVLRSEKDAAINTLLESVANNVSQAQFRIELRQAAGPKGKPVYKLDGSAECFFVSKQIQKNLQNVYKIKPANRHEATSRLISMLNTKFPHELIRTDISSFYESIDSVRLLAKLDEDQLLGTSSRKLLRQMLDSYRRLSGSNDGVPRGIGVSAYLAEIFLRDLDRSLQGLPGVSLYVRYVDDIAIIFSRKPEGVRRNHMSDVSAEFQHRRLVQNQKKTSEHALNDPACPKFSFLGYRFRKGKEGWKISPSGAKLWKLRRRLLASFEAYEKQKSRNARHAFRSLVARVRFLTGNTRLVNSKGSAVTGIYYNNSQANDVTALQQLDRLLKKKVASTRNRSLKARLKPLSFHKGFVEREYRQFKPKELENIVKVWRYVS